MYLGPYNIISTPSEHYRNIAFKLVRDNLKPILLAGLAYVIANEFVASVLDSYQIVSDQAASIISIILLIIVGPLALGYTSVCLKLYRGEQFEPSDAFYGFNHTLNAFLTNLLMYIYIILWSILLVIPGIVKAYAYRLTFFILCDNPTLSPNEAITESKRITYCNKSKCFFLELSFILWDIFAGILVFVIGKAVVQGNIAVALILTVADLVYILWLNAYKNVSFAALYNDIITTEDVNKANDTQYTNTSYPSYQQIKDDMDN